jgi:DNA repair exonuclease SbcCD ATPase subunit
LERHGTGATGEPEPADWEIERQSLRKEIEEMQDTMKGSVQELQQQVNEMRQELEDAQEDRDRFAHENEQIARLAHQTQSDLDKLKSDNRLLETRASDAETKVALLLDQVESSVDNYRRQSQNMGAHNRNTSQASATLGHAHHASAGGDSSDFSSSQGGTERNSLALDNLASELETLRTQWEGTRRSYRLSNNYDASGSAHPAFGGDGALSSSLANWRRRLDAEEKNKESRSGSASGSGQAI